MKKTEQLRKGDIVRLLDFGNASANYRHLLLSLGITRGAEILVKRVAPLGCPIQIEVLGVDLALRKDEAKELLWE
jgi:ferrous iron transport protein A